MLFWVGLCLLLSISPAGSAEASTPKRWCHREHKAVGGKWTDVPPYWELPNCPNQPFGVEATRKCMTGRTLYVIGNSIARQNAFGLVEMLGGMNVKRENQRDMCPKAALTWSSSCSQELAGVKIRYLSLQFMDGIHYDNRGGFPYYKRRVNTTDNKGAQWTTGPIPSMPHVVEDEFRGGDIGRTFDNCKDISTDECFKRFFEGSTEDDVLMLTMGMWYCFATLAEYKQQEKEAKNDWLIDFPAWIAGSAVNFKEHVTRHFHGHVFHSTLAPASSSGNVRHKSAWFRDTNEILAKVWTHSSVGAADSKKLWYTIDQWPINEGRDHLYIDALHFTGILTHATLHQMLNELCTGQGDDAIVVQHPRVDLANSLVVLDEALPDRQIKVIANVATGNGHDGANGNAGYDSANNSTSGDGDGASGGGKNAGVSHDAVSKNNSVNNAIQYYSVHFLIDSDGYRHELQFAQQNSKLLQLALQLLSSSNDHYYRRRLSATTIPTKSVNHHNDNTTSRKKRHREHVTTTRIIYNDKIVHFKNSPPVDMANITYVDLAENAIRNISLSHPYTELQDGALIKGHSRDVYWFRNGTKSAFNDVQSFVKHGFDFDQVIAVPNAFVQLIPTGPPIT